MEGTAPERATLHERLNDHVPIGGSASSLASLPARLLASWQRCEQYGVPLEDVEPVFSGTVDQDSLFTDCGREVLTSLHHVLASEPISLMLTDANGVVLSRFCGDGRLLRSLDAVHLAPGFAYAECDVGTNGVGLALADRAPTLVRAEEHYVISLCQYTCAAAPVFEPETGLLLGSVNITTWAQSSSNLLLALAQSAAGNTAALISSRGSQRRTPSSSGSATFTVKPAPLTALAGPLSPAWEQSVGASREAMTAGGIVAALGEYGAGRYSVLVEALRRTNREVRIVSAGGPAAADAQTWLSLVEREFARPQTVVIFRDVDTLPAWVAERLPDVIVHATGCTLTRQPTCAVTASRYDDIAAPLADLIDTVVEVPSLRDRTEDIVPLAHHLARRVGGRNIELTPAAQHALCNHSWPGNVTQLRQAIAAAAQRSGLIDVTNLPPEVFANPGHRLSRVEAFERDEIVRTLDQRGITMKCAAERLGMSRATLYRRIRQYGIRTPRSRTEA